MGRSLDMTIAPSLAAVAAASLTGPKVCQRYICDPLLYQGRKFDLRVLVAVRSFFPDCTALTWRDVFVRAANRRYTPAAAALGDFQTQFTSMRQGGFEEAAVSIEELAADMATQGLQWSVAEARMRGMIREVLAAAAPRVAAACGGGAFARGRALYGIDVMFDREARPKLLEARPCR
jgi:tubulin--tyrosine ligase-like protein 12